MWLVAEIDKFMKYARNVLKADVGRSTFRRLFLIEMLFVGNIA